MYVNNIHVHILKHCTCIEGLNPQSIPLQAQRTCADVTGWKSARRRICLCVSTIRTVKMTVLVCLRVSCSHSTGSGGP